jgi:hypothetical protein
MATLNDKQEALCAQTRWDFSDLRALFVNCTLKRSPERSHTQVMAADILVVVAGDEDGVKHTPSAGSTPNCQSIPARSGRFGMTERGCQFADLRL